jgi:uncharacterized membrane protein YkvA (DUF1232 family)
MLEAVREVNAGTYRDIPWGAVALMAGALLYAVNPVDVVPSSLRFLNALDDVAVVAIVVRLVHKDLRRYCEYRGYRAHDYF